LHDNFGRITRWPMPLLYGVTEVESNGGLVWRYDVEVAGNVRREEQLYATNRPPALAYESATFWDTTNSVVDFGRMAFDILMFIRFALRAFAHLARSRHESASIATFTNSLLVPTNGAVAHLTMGIDAAQPDRAATFDGMFIPGQPVEVPCTA